MVSVFDAENDRIQRTRNLWSEYYNILKYGYIPLAKTIKVILDIVKMQWDLLWSNLLDLT